MAWSYTDEPDITPRGAARAAGRAREGGARWIVAVAACFTLCQFLFVPVHLGLGFDETVYVSQVGTRAPAAFFSAPRARGVSYLVAPVTAFTSSTAALRTYLALLSGAGLLGALWVWRPLRSGRVLGMAGLLFAGLWITQFYGPQAMSNLWVALASLACAGFFLRATGRLREPATRDLVTNRSGFVPRPDRPEPDTNRPQSDTNRPGPDTDQPRSDTNRLERDTNQLEPETDRLETRGAHRRFRHPERWAAAGLALTLAAVVQLRPPDGFWLALPLALAALAVPAWRRAAVFCALGAGLALGAAQWLVESYTRYGGVAARLAASDRVEGGLGLHLAFGDQLRSLGGRTLCRPCTGAWPGPVHTAWWYALPVLVACGLFLAHRARALGSDLLPALCGVSMAVPYLLLVSYAAPRFLLPAYALLSLPAARCVVWLAAGAGRPARRRVATGLVAAALAAHLVVQHVVLAHTVAGSVAARSYLDRVAGELRTLGVAPPCLITGANAISVGYLAGCASGATGGNNGNTTAAEITATARRLPVAVLVPAGQGAPPYAATWSRHPLPASGRVASYTAYVAPPPK